MLPQESEYTDDEGVRFTLDVPPPSSRAISIAGSYHCSWKPRSNHFQSHADFKPKGLQSLTLVSAYKQIRCLKWAIYSIKSVHGCLSEHTDSSGDRSYCIIEYIVISMDLYIYLFTKCFLLLCS